MASVNSVRANADSILARPCYAPAAHEGFCGRDPAYVAGLGGAGANFVGGTAMAIPGLGNQHDYSGQYAMFGYSTQTIQHDDGSSIEIETYDRDIPESWGAQHNWYDAGNPRWLTVAASLVWQSPQIVLGFILAGGAAMLGATFDINTTGELVQINGSLDSSVKGLAITLGPFSIYTGSPSDQVAADVGPGASVYFAHPTVPIGSHEYEHLPQSAEMGPWYVPFAVLSMVLTFVSHIFDGPALGTESGPYSYPPRP